MTVDLNRCVGCQTCTIACKHSNDTSPEVQWRRVLDIETGSFPDVERLFMVTGCQHCAEPPCVPVCPTGATAQRADGLVTMNYDLCIGCAYCAVSCPYQARTIVHDHEWYYGEETIQEEKVEHNERLGVAQKCTFCIERIDESKESAVVPGNDLDYTPACAASCIAEALVFGDFNDPGSTVSKLVTDKPSFQMHKELGTDPQIKYLYETPAVPGRDPNEEDLDDERLGDPANPLVGERQTFWDLRAAMNFVLGGMSSGLGVVAVVAWMNGNVLTIRSMWGLLLLSAVVMGAGLFFVWLKIGRKLRAGFAILRPQTSWMSREMYVVGVYYVGIAGWILWRPEQWLINVIGLAAFAFLYCQARILQACMGIPAWRVPLMVWMLLATGVYEGLGLYALSHVLNPLTIQFGGANYFFGATLALINGVLWHRYRVGARANGMPPLSRALIERWSLPLHLFGHGLPGLIFSIGIVHELPPLLLATGCVLAVVGGIFWKVLIITRASYQQGFAIARFPQRGSGTRAAPARLSGHPAPTAST